VLTTEVPTRAELVQRAADLAPLIRQHAAWTEENRRVHDEVIDALAAAGIFRLRTPKRYGGYEVDTRTLVEVGAELARADGSTAWAASVYWIPGWMACQFPDEVQDEVFSTPDVRICGTLSPTAMATPVEGGIVVNGKWGFISGAPHAHWQEIVAVLIAPDSEPMPIVGLVPMSDLMIVDDWYTSGLRGTGSVSTVANEVFVPQGRFLPLPAILEGQGASKINSESPIYNAPLLPVASASSVGPVLGMGMAGQDAFLQRLPERKISYTTYESQSEAPLTHLQVADASMKIDEAEFHAHRLSSLVDTKCADRSEWTIADRAKARADMGMVCKLAKDAVEILNTASGGSSIYSDVPIQRISRDVQAINLHALMHPDTNSELYGRILCGQEPNTLYI